MSYEEIQIEEVFLKALEIQSLPARSAFLDEACAANDELRRRVERMLAAQPQLGSFLDQNAAGIVLTIDQPVTERPGTQIGPYKLLQQIGEGGFGVVYMAEQTEPVRRKVALKLIKPGMDTRQVIARFEAERQALAVMDHPNIAKVLDAGTVGLAVAPHSLERQVDNLLQAGRPYFVMELVRGIPITQYCDENSLPIRERLELFATVCQAIQHAHTKGIIHRDIKPTNVLVTRQDGQPVVKVIDFGVAKAMGQALTDKTLFTEFAQMIGTPLYMSPEQAELSSTDIDTRSDIYSLGVLLYELLTGSTPVSKEQLKQAAFDEIRRIIREDEPQKPSTRISTAEAAPSIAAQRHTEPAKLAKLVRGELDWIVMKALEKDRNRRYETANGFARDVQRYLEDEPVQAGPPSRWYRFRKFARRNKKALVMIATVAVVLLTGSIISTWQAVRATRAQQAAQVNFERAHGAVKRMLTRVSKEELIDVPWMEPVRKALLEDALQFYEQLLAERSADPEIRFAKAQTHLDLAWINGRYGDKARHEADIRLALELLEPLVKEFPENLRYRAGLANGLHHQSHQTAWSPKRCKEAEQVLRRAVKLQESVVSATPDSADNAYDLANMLHLLGTALHTGGKPEEAEAAYARVVSIGEQFTAKDPDHPAHLRAQIRGLTSMAAMIRLKDAPRAEALLLRAQALAARFQAARRKTGFLFDTAADTVAQVDQVLGRVYQQTGRPKEADAAFRRAIATYKRYAAEFPALEFYQVRLAQALTPLARSLIDPADRGEAEQLWQQVIAIYEKRANEFPQTLQYRLHLLGAYRAYGQWLQAVDRHDEAKRAYRRALDIALKLVADAPEEVEYKTSAAGIAESLGVILQQGERFEDAEQLFHQALQLHQADAAADPTDKTHFARAAQMQRRLAQLLRTRLKPTAEGFTPLFNGKDLTGWAAARGGMGMWKIEDGALTCTGPRDHLLTTRNDFGDFHLRAEVKINANGNSGIYIRASKPLALIGDYEAQITDNPGQKFKTGSLYDLVRETESPAPPGTWFTYEIIAVDKRIRIRVNGKQTADYAEHRAGRNTQGHIALQHHDPSTRVFFRKIEIRELSRGKSVANGAFVLLGGQGVAEHKFDTLIAAVQAAVDGDTIDVRGNGPFITAPINCGQTALTIRAGEGFRPVIKLSPEAQQNVDLLKTSAALVLEGLELHRAVSASEAPLRAANCRFRANISANRSPVCVLRNCEFLADEASVFMTYRPGARVIFENYLHRTKRQAIVCAWDDSALHDVSIQIRGSTVVSRNASLWLPLRSPLSISADRPEVLFRLKVTGSLFAAPTTLGFWQDRRFLAQAAELGPVEAEATLLRLLDWRGERNLFATGSTSVGWYVDGKQPSPGPKRGPQNLEQWKQFWGTGEPDSLEGFPQFQGGDLLSRTDAALDQLTPDDFRLLPDSPGYRAGPDGKDLGADVDLVGPGAAYERWKKTTDYQEWLKETGQVK